MTGLRPLGIWAVLALTAILTPAPALAARCVEAGGILDVPVRGFLRDEEPNLTLDFRSGESVPVEPLSMTASRLRIQLPASGLPDGESFKVRHHPDRGPAKVVANGKLCPSGPVDPVDPVDPEDPEDPDGPDDPGTPRAGETAGRTAMGARGARLPFERATATDVAAPSGAPEYLLAGTARETARAEAVLLRLGVTVLRRNDLDGLRLSILALDMNGVVRPAQLRSALSRAGVDVVVDRHSVYRAAATDDTATPELVAMSTGAGCRLSPSVRIGIVDGPIDTSNPALSQVAIRSTSVLGEREKQGSTEHATGIAALIAGTGGERIPSGVAAGAQLYSVVAFARNGGRDVARLENIAEAIDWLIAARVGLVNLSLAGPQNETLAEVLRIADENGIVMVAAAGNNARPELAYPASDPRVIAVTAVDAANRPYRKANYGAGMAFAAPGVDVAVPSGRGNVAHRSGTSYAAAYATAVVAQAMARGAQGRAGVVAALRQSATDLGPAGRDERFGWGLISAPNCN